MVNSIIPAKKTPLKFQTQETQKMLMRIVDCSLHAQATLQTVGKGLIETALSGGGGARILVRLVELVLVVVAAVVAAGVDLVLVAVAHGSSRAGAAAAEGAVGAGGRAAVGHGAGSGGCGRDHRVWAAAVVVLGIERELVGSHGVAGLGVDDVGKLAVLAGWGRSAAIIGGGGVVVGGDIVDTSGSLGRPRGDGGSGRRAAGRSGGGGEIVVKDVKSQFAGGLNNMGLVWVVGLKVAIEDEVVPVTGGGHGGAKSDGDGPPTGSRLFGVHLVPLSVVVPRASKVAALDVSGSAESEGGSRSGDRHGDFFGLGNLELSKISYWFFVRDLTSRF
jgi:hypothetical protein